MVFMLPMLAQVDHDYNPNDVDISEMGRYTISQDKVPPSVLKAMTEDFKLDSPATWSKFPYALHEYGWVYDKAASDVKPDNYEITFDFKDGKKLYAVYSAKGDLIATREISKDIVIPPYVLESLSKSKYSDWTIVGNTEVIRYNHDKNAVEQHIRLTLEKDNETRSISFNYQGKVNEKSK